jgi:DNA-directed RNA polymerase II subunit RPB2
LVNVHSAKFFGLDQAPHGQQLMVAIACFTGYNQEDSVMINSSAVQRGLFNSWYFKTHVAKKNVHKASTNETECFGMSPDPALTADRKGSDKDKKSAYRYLDPKTGIVRLGTRFENVNPDEDIVIASRYVTTKGCGEKVSKGDRGRLPYRDISVTIQPVEGTIIDKIIGPGSDIKNVDENGNEFIKIREVIMRKPVIGDKVASRSAQKGTIGMTYRQDEMPFTSNGMVPDIIINPHSQPSRMTIGQIIESLISKYSVQTGEFVDATAFTNMTPEPADQDDPLRYYTRKLAEMGFHPKGEEVMFNPQTGEQFEATIFYTPTYYQRLKHMVHDKMHARETGPVKTTTRQPSDGRSRRPMWSIRIENIFWFCPKALQVPVM